MLTMLRCELKSNNEKAINSKYSPSMTQQESIKKDANVF